MCVCVRLSVDHEEREVLGSAANGSMLNIYTLKVFADNRDASITTRLSLIKTH